MPSATSGSASGPATRFAHRDRWPPRRSAARQPIESSENLRRPPPEVPGGRGRRNRPPCRATRSNRRRCGPPGGRHRIAGAQRPILEDRHRHGLRRPLSHDDPRLVEVDRRWTGPRHPRVTLDRAPIGHVDRSRCRRRPTGTAGRQGGEERVHSGVVGGGAVHGGEHGGARDDGACSAEQRLTGVKDGHRPADLRRGSGPRHRPRVIRRHSQRPPDGRVGSAAARFGSALAARRRIFRAGGRCSMVRCGGRGADPPGRRPG